MKTLTLMAACLALPALVIAQSSMSDGTREAVMAPIYQLFEGMRQNDSSMVSAVFMPGAALFTATTGKDGQPVLSQSGLEPFLKAVGTPKDQAWDEPVWDEKVEVEGNLAAVWCKYAFYVGGNFSHCGVDAFHLFKTEDGWKIFHLTDTRKKENCELPPGR